MKRLLTAALLLAFGAALSACESAQTTTRASTPSPTPDVHALAAQYAAIADQGNKAMAQLLVEFPSVSTVPQYNAFGTKAAAAYHDVDAQLRKLHFPDSMRNDVTNVLKADTVIEAIFISISTDTSIAAINADADKLTTAGVDKKAAVEVLRHDLGLPPATDSTA